MSGARLRLVLAAVLFVGWLGWLAYAVSQKGKAPVLSRAQLTAATHLLAAEVTVGSDGLPAPTVTVVEVVQVAPTYQGESPQAGGRAEVLNLANAKPPGPGDFPGPGVYLLPVVGDGKTFRVAGLPRSPGYEATTVERPAIYPWNDDTKAQLRGLGVVSP